MKVNNVVLCEDVGAMLSYKQLSPFDLGILRKVSEGKFDPDNIKSESAEESYDLLINLGLVDSLSNELTDKGMQVLKMGVNHGSYERRMRNNATEKSTDDYDDLDFDDDSNDGFEIE